MTYFLLFEVRKTYVYHYSENNTYLVSFTSGIFVELSNQSDNTIHSIKHSTSIWNLSGTNKFKNLKYQCVGRHEVRLYESGRNSSRCLGLFGEAIINIGISENTQL